MAILKITVDDDHANELKKVLHGIDIVKSVEQEQSIQYHHENIADRIENILDKFKGMELFKDITDPVKWQKKYKEGLWELIL